MLTFLDSLSGLEEDQESQDDQRPPIDHGVWSRVSRVNCCPDNNRLS